MRCERKCSNRVAGVPNVERAAVVSTNCESMGFCAQNPGVDDAVHHGGYAANSISLANRDGVTVICYEAAAGNSVVELPAMVDRVGRASDSCFEEKEKEKENDVDEYAALEVKEESASPLGCCEFDIPVLDVEKHGVSPCVESVSAGSYPAKEDDSDLPASLPDNCKRGVGCCSPCDESCCSCPC